MVFLPLRLIVPLILSDLLIYSVQLFLSCTENLNMNGQIIKQVEEVKVTQVVPPTLQQPSNTSWHNLRRLILVPRSAQKGYSVGHWPIPESFWPDNTSGTLVSLWL